MPRLFTILLAFVLLAPGAPPAHAQSDVAGVTQVLQSLDSTLHVNGFTLRERYVGPIRPDLSLSASMVVNHDRHYMIIGVCDLNCDGAELEVRAPDGEVLLAGTAESRLTYLRFASEDEDELELVRSVESCRAEECAIGYNVYERRHTSELGVCVLQDHSLAEVTALYDPVEGDTIVQGRPFSEVYPTAAPAYAATTSWWRAGEPVEFEGNRYVKYGLPRVFSARELVRTGESRGIDVFVQPGVANMINVPLRPGCEFQPYQRVP